ncbi:MAG: 3-phosphoshikimate 1-carboxyvinyltransferase [Planctomycetales bacterium]|nr:3-phosphoshikimate 1-carboxyvinyltransferase [Planctomycetales bacterium]
MGARRIAAGVSSFTAAVSKSLPESIEISPSGPVAGIVRPPGSKSITNRALICAALAEGNSTLRGALDSEDTRVMIAALRAVGIAVETRDDSTVLDVAGQGGRIPADTGDLYIANSGTSVRFLTAMLTLGRGTYRLDGTVRMRERPIGDLLAALRSWGANVACEAASDCPPVVVRADGLRGGSTTVAGNLSSQYLSGLLMAAPYADDAAVIEVDGVLVSRPYVDMTLAVMRSFGVKVSEPRDGRFEVPVACYQGREYDVEPDASAASYFFAAAAITGGEVTVSGLTADSLQGDVAFVDVLEQMGCRVTRHDDAITVSGAGGKLHGVDIDMNAISDTVQTLGPVALFAEGPTTVRGVAHIRHKETDRIGALARELRKLGAEVVELADGLQITPGRPRGAEIDTYDDHRMAMGLALAGLRIPRVVIRNPQCTAKTYPRFFDDLSRICRSAE